MTFIFKETFWCHTSFSRIISQHYQAVWRHLHICHTGNDMIRHQPALKLTRSILSIREISLAIIVLSCSEGRLVFLTSLLSLALFSPVCLQKVKSPPMWHSCLAPLAMPVFISVKADVTSGNTVRFVLNCFWQDVSQNRLELTLSGVKTLLGLIFSCHLVLKDMIFDNTEGSWGIGVELVNSQL